MSRPLIAILTLSLLGPATPSRAQLLPGGHGRSAGSVRAEYLARVLEGVNETRTRLTEAWNAHDAAALTALFAENASLVPPEGDSWTGREPGAGHLAPVSGVVMSVFVREGREWLVRSQVFRPSAQVGLRRSGPG